jgi:hypothetical protein
MNALYHLPDLRRQLGEMEVAIAALQANLKALQAPEDMSNKVSEPTVIDR